MASVDLPNATYKLSIPKEIIKKGAPSDIQLEAATYACQTHEQRLPDGRRKEYLCGDSCVSKETRIFNPITNKSKTIEELYKEGKNHVVLSITKHGFVPAFACAPFIKGVTNLFKVKFDSGKEISITNKHKTIKQKTTDVVMPEGISQSVWDEFIAHRKAKKAKVTQLVIEGIGKEASKAGWSLEDALKETIVRNWQSFKADWVAVKPQMQNKWDVAGITTPPPPNQDAALRKIEEDRKKAVPPSLETLAKLAELRKGVQA
jgi:hypothetical protein